SERFINALDERLGFPRSDPHGDAIPDAHGEHRPSQATRLDHFSGTEALIVRISDEAPHFLRRCQQQGLVPGARIGLPHRLDPIEASMVWV
ncbi:metal-dependent transcriptional regulator, partial [Escherichia coli]|nr:metal-dependent transcriptional regulator [Escherichia coli]